MRCKNCKMEYKQIKAGKTSAGSQTYKCNHCKKCFFRSIDTTKVVLKIFVNAFNNFALHKFLHPSLKSAFSLSSFIWLILFGTPFYKELIIIYNIVQHKKLIQKYKLQFLEFINKLSHMRNSKLGYLIDYLFFPFLSILLCCLNFKLKYFFNNRHINLILANNKFIITI